MDEKNINEEESKKKTINQQILTFYIKRASNNSAICDVSKNIHCFNEIYYEMYGSFFENMDSLKLAAHNILKRQLFCRKRGMFISYPFIVSQSDIIPTFGIGWSLCKTDDKFDKDIGFNICLTRAKKQIKYLKNDNGRLVNLIELNNIPINIHNDLFEFMCRCKKYYKDFSMPVIIHDNQIVEINC